MIRHGLSLAIYSTILFTGCESDAEFRTEANTRQPVMDSRTSSAQQSPAPSMPVAEKHPAASDLHSSHSTQLARTAAGYTESIGQEGLVDWTTGIVTATGIGYGPADAINSTQGRLLAKRAAYAVALRNLLEAFKAVRVDSTTTVKNHVAISDEIQVKVTGLVEDARIVEERDLEKGGYEIKLEMKLTGRVSEMFVPNDTTIRKPLVPELAPRPIPKPSGPYTGLVVDARGMNVRPALIPKILTEDGQEAYSQSYVLAKYRQDQRIAAYVSDPSAAQIHPKVTNHPLVVKALRTAGSSQTDLVISNAAAQTIHGVKEHFEFLEKAQVIVIIDRGGQ